MKTHLSVLDVGRTVVKVGYGELTHFPSHVKISHDILLARQTKKRRDAPWEGQDGTELGVVLRGTSSCGIGYRPVSVQQTRDAMSALLFSVQPYLHPPGEGYSMAAVTVNAAMTLRAKVAIIDVLLSDQFAFDAVIFVDPAAAVLSTMPVSSGLCIDVSGCGTSVTPVVEGQAIKLAPRSSYMGGDFVTVLIRELTREFCDQDEWTKTYEPMSLIEWAGVKISGIAVASKTELVVPSSSDGGRGGLPSELFLLAAEALVTRIEDIDPVLFGIKWPRLEAGEAFAAAVAATRAALDINPEDELLPIPQLLFAALEACDKSLHDFLLGNVVLYGGAAETPNLRERLAEELTNEGFGKAKMGIPLFIEALVPWVGTTRLATFNSEERRRLHRFLALDRRLNGPGPQFSISMEAGFAAGSIGDMLPEDQVTGESKKKKTDKDLDEPIRGVVPRGGWIKGRSYKDFGNQTFPVVFDGYVELPTWLLDISQPMDRVISRPVSYVQRKTE